MKLEKNYNGYGERFLNFWTIEQFKVGQVLTDMKHWSDGNGCLYLDEGNVPTYQYLFECENVVGHKVDYNKMKKYLDDDEEEINEDYNEEYTEYLSINYGTNDSYEEETEIIVDENEKFEIIEICKVDNERDEIVEEDFQFDDSAYLRVIVKRI